MATPVFWEGNIGSAPEHRSFPNGNNPPRQLLRLNVMFDNSIPDGQGGYKDRGGFWCSGGKNFRFGNLDQYEVQCVKESDPYRQAGQATLQRSPPDCTGSWR